MIERLVCILIGYIFGCIQSGFIVGKIKGIDIRNHGSGNAGTTNTLRTLGLKYGLLVLFLDIIKVGLAIGVVKLLYGNAYDVELPLLEIYAATGAILGHNFPFYMNFKGGKGFAATAGFVIFGLGWKMTIICFIIFAIDFAVTHYVSLGAIIIYTTLIISTLVYWKLDIFSFTANGMEKLYQEYFIVILFLAVLIIARHKENIKRLINGTERKTYLKSKPEIDVDSNK